MIDRPISQSQEFFFGRQVLGCGDFWNYLKVPYAILLDSLAIAGQTLKDQIRAAMFAAAPESIRNLDPDNEHRAKGK
jgi:hypothetical protein